MSEQAHFSILVYVRIWIISYVLFQLLFYLLYLTVVSSPYFLDSAYSVMQDFNPALCAAAWRAMLHSLLAASLLVALCAVRLRLPWSLTCCCSRGCLSTSCLLFRHSVSLCGAARPRLRASKEALQSDNQCADDAYWLSRRLLHTGENAHPVPIPAWLIIVLLPVLFCLLLLVSSVLLLPKGHVLRSPSKLIVL